MTARETTEIIVKRHIYGEKRVPEKEFEDPEPHSILDDLEIIDK